MERKCCGQIHLMNNNTEVTGKEDHAPVPAKIEMKQSLSEVRRKSSQSRDTPRLIIQETQATLSEEAVAELPSYSSFQRMIQRKRKHDNVPIPNPATLRKINVPEELRRTLIGDIFLMHDCWPDDTDRFLIFATQENLNSIAQYREWFADGTFKITPHLFLSDIYHPLFMPRCNSSDGLLFFETKK